MSRPIRILSTTLLVFTLQAMDLVDDLVLTPPIESKQHLIESFEAKELVAQQGITRRRCFDKHGNLINTHEAHKFGLPKTLINRKIEQQLTPAERRLFFQWYERGQLTYQREITNTLP